MSDNTEKKANTTRVVVKEENGKLFAGVQILDKKGRVRSTGSLLVGADKPGKASSFEVSLPRSEKNQIFLFRALSREERDAVFARAVWLAVANQQLRQKDLASRVDWVSRALGEQNFGDRQQEQLDAEEKELRSPEGIEPCLSLSKERIYLCVFSDDFQMQCVWGTRGDCMKTVLRCTIVMKKFWLDGAGLHFRVRMCAVNPYGLNLRGVCLQVGTHLGEAVPVAQVKQPPLTTDKRDYECTISVSMADLLNREYEQDGSIENAGNLCWATLLLEDLPEVFGEHRSMTVPCRLARRVQTARQISWLPKHSKREAWVPVSAVYRDGYAIHLRRGFSGVFVLYKRPMEEIEHSGWFRFMESRFVSGLFFHLGRLLNHVPGRKKVALFNEKYSEKAEEGVFELFRLCRESRKTRCFFVLDRNFPDYQRLKGEKGVVAKYSLKYYWLLFNVNYYISSEAPSHLTLMNSNNLYLRRNLIRHPFIFLQHGVTYLKRHGARSTYLKGKAGQADYVVVNSEKERKIVSEMLKLRPDRIWNTGMLIFDQIQYGHINQDSPDKITVMLTWRQDEELLQNYEESSYFQFTMSIYQMLLRHVDRSQISIVAHPRAYELLKTTSLGDLLWDKPIAEVLSQSKLLITDYSSVCWNSFYQGGAVIFFQPDLEKYESFVGKLIPTQKEYIGPRVFDLESLEQVVSQGVQDGRVLLNVLRTEENEKMYLSINEHHDGQNTQRVFKRLQANGFV